MKVIGCPTCGSRLKEGRKFCSVICSNTRRRNRAYRTNLSRALRAKWRSGTRKPNSEESRIKMGNTLKRLYAEGKLVRPELPVEIRARIGLKVSKIHSGKVLRKTPMRDWEKEQLRERVKNDPRLAKGIENVHAKDWRIRSPKNVVFEFHNLSHFIREHPELFLEEDIIWRNKQCHASAGIQSICPRKKHPAGSWKGWTWYSHLEKVKFNGQDLLQRQINETLP